MCQRLRPPWEGERPAEPFAVRKVPRSPSPERRYATGEKWATAPTGYTYDSIQVYLSPTDQDEAIYVVGPFGSERWPRSDPMTLCS